ncbi:MAG: hypothetical protein K5978_06250 [Campylobacter sp.]|nr:hypothetical protein [Campylobacter sp.]
MKKFAIFLTFVKVFAFDIDDLNRGYEAINAKNFSEAYDIFIEGCDANDAIACQELGFMYLNGEISDKTTSSDENLGDSKNSDTLFGSETDEKSEDLDKKDENSTKATPPSKEMQKIGLEYILKSCTKLDYLNACGDLLTMKDDMAGLLNDETLEQIGAKYEELSREFYSDNNITNVDENLSK